jgi:hypothetical protein
MTPDQIDTLAQKIANSVPDLVWERSAPQGRPFRPENLKRLYVEKNDVRNIIVATLHGVPPLP